MKKYAFRFTGEKTFSGKITRHNFLLRCMPGTYPFQRTYAHKLTLTHRLCDPAVEWGDIKIGDVPFELVQRFTLNEAHQYLYYLRSDRGNSTATRARKASAPESVIILSGKCVGEEYEVQVIDHGIGIPEEEISKIQEAFYMVDKSRARGQGGSGLGLATTTRIIEAHGGRMEIESVYGEGTVVHVYLPMDRKENTGLAVKEQGDKHMYQTGTEKRTRV